MLKTLRDPVSHIVWVYHELRNFVVGMINKSCCRIDYERSPYDDKNVCIFYEMNSFFCFWAKKLAKPNNKGPKLRTISSLIAKTNRNIQRILFNTFRGKTIS